MPHLAQVRPPGIGAAGGALTVAGGRAAGRAGPGATSGGLDPRPASPLRGATGARAGGSLATIGGGGGGTTLGSGGGGVTLGAGAADGFGVDAGLGAGLGAGPGGGGGGGGGVGGVGAGGAGAGTGGVGSEGGSGLDAWLAASWLASSAPAAAASSVPDALAGSLVRAPLHSRNALHDSQKVASSGFSWPQFVQTITPIPHPAAGAGPLSPMNGPETVPRRTRRATIFPSVDDVGPAGAPAPKSRQSSPDDRCAPG